MRDKVNENAIDQVIAEMKDVVVKSKDDIFYISEEAHNEYAALKSELEEVKLKVEEHIELSEKMSFKVRGYRRRLSIVSKEFATYSEEEIREVYDKTYKYQAELAILHKDEAALRLRRDDLERRIKRLRKTIEHAENVGGKISAILTYLENDFQTVTDVLKSARETQEFGLKIIEAQEEERKKLSREIHDGPAQMLANLLIRSEIIDRSFREGGIDVALMEIKTIRKTIRQSLYEVRRIIYNLRPMALDDLGLVPTLRKYISTVSEISESEITLTHIGREERLAPEYEVAVFRLVQEAIQNAVKHSQSTLVKVKLEIGHKHVNLIVDDNGIGFDPENVSENSFGLLGMRERVEMLSGQLTLSTIMNKGTTIVIQIPIENSKALQH